MIVRADVAQLVERVLGKDEVTSSILVIGSSPLVLNSPGINSTKLLKVGYGEGKI